VTSRVPVLIVHGGAGADPKTGREELRAGITEAARAGWERLAGGGSSLDAVEAAVRALEDHPRFNAGRGSVLTSAGTVEMDASIMEGDRLANGAVACVTGLRHPITLARRILEAGRHSFFVGEGALAQARALGVPLCDPAELVLEHQQRRLQEVQSGTVGAVALDRAGVIAAAASTGGTTGKLPGRVGDSPLIGCGAYAESTLGGVSCTGDGEAIIRVVLARRTLEIMKSVGDPMHACQVAVDVLVEEGRGGGGLIGVDWRGRIGWAHSTPLMPVGWANPTQGVVVGF
jgi:L-asparaginase / beta-aspartyl-peptidase